MLKSHNHNTSNPWGYYGVNCNISLLIFKTKACIFCLSSKYNRYNIYSFFQNAYMQFFLIIAPFLKTLHTKPQNTHNIQKSHILQKQTLFLNLLKNIFLHSNSTHNHKIISHIHAKHTCEKCKTLLLCVFYMFIVQWSTGVCHSTHTYCTCICTYTLYIQYVWMMNFTQLCNWTESILNWLEL